MVIVVIITIGVLRFRKRISGGIVNKNKIIGSMILYFAISTLTVFSSFQVGVSTWYLFAYVGMLTGSTYLSNKLVSKRITLWRTDDGLIHAKGGNISYIIWFGGLVLRFILGYVFIGSDYFLSMYGAQKIANPSALGFLIIVDLIMMLGVGVLTGRNMQIISKLKSFK